MTGKQRLKVLGNYLLSGAVDEDEFDMNRWSKCAIGEGSRLASLKKEGLALELDEDGSPVPAYNGETNFEACASFFRIPYRQAETFFDGLPRSAATVGRQLLNYVRRH